MSEPAICRYHCPNCDTELEQEGYIVVDAEDSELAQALIDNTLNREVCPNCGQTNTLAMPLFYHSHGDQLLICYMPDAGQMSPEELAEAMRYPYEVLISKVAVQLNIEMPQPDDAAFMRGEENLYSPFAALTQEQAAALFPEYLLRPTVVDGIEVVGAIVQAVRDGMKSQDVLDDMARLQLINGIIGAPDPITRRKVLHHSEPYLNAELYEVLDTLTDQMQQEGNAEMVERLSFVRKEVERYKAGQANKLNKRKAGAASTTVETSDGE